jgi:hypothetical protein
MSPVALILNVLLGGLLIAALALGLRLDRRLRALRDSQAGFIKAVAELDQAAARTQAGLAQWREATDEARELLHDRTEKAKVQIARLDKLLADTARLPEPRIAEARAPESRAPDFRPPEPRVADRFADRLGELRLNEPPRPQQQRPAAGAIPEAPAFIREALREAAKSAGAEPVLTLGPRDALRAGPAPAAAPARTARTRPAVDDDLFESAPKPAAASREFPLGLGRRP